MHIMFCHLGRENLGIEYLSAVLKQNGFKVNLAFDPGYFSKQDNTIYSPFWERVFKREKEMLEMIYKEKPDIVAFSVYTETYKWAKTMAKLIKDHFNTKIIFGGSHPTLVPEVVINEKYVDYVLIGEGEKNLVDLVRSIENREKELTVGSLYYKNKGKVIKNEISNYLTNLDLLPYPDKELFEKHIGYKDDYMTIASRGCKNSCTYCCESYLNKMYKDRYFRQRSVDSVIGELQYMKEKYNFKEVIFFDDIFHFDKKWLRGFVKEYKSKIDTPFKCMAHVSMFDKETAVLLKDSNCYCVNFGIQSMSESVRNRILGRQTDTKQIEDSFKICDEVGLSFDVDLIFNLPGDNLSEIAKAAPFYKRFRRLNRIKCFNLSYYPKLEILNTAIEEKIISPCSIASIENGEDATPFYLTNSGRNRDPVLYSLRNFYRLLPALPSRIVRYCSLKNRFRVFNFFPEFFILIFQIMIGIRNRDKRFAIYLKNYIKRLKYLLNI